MLTIIYISLRGLIAGAIVDSLASAIVGSVVGQAVVSLAVIGMSARRLWLADTGGTSFRGGAACAVSFPAR